MNNISSSTNFTSTIIPKASFSNLNKYTTEIGKYFEVRGFGGDIEKVRNKINLGQAGVGLGKDGIFIVGKEKSADNFIYRTVKSLDGNAKYIDDAPELKCDSPTIDFTI